MSIKVHCISNNVYTKLGKRYDSFSWDEDWKIILGIIKKELNGILLYKSCKTVLFSEYTLAYIIYWYDKNILQQIDKVTIFTPTLDVRLRIVQSLVDKLAFDDNLKRIIKQCLVNTYKEFRIAAYEEYSKELPF